MRRIASTAQHATSRTPTRTARGFLLRAAAGKTIRTCEGVFTRIPGRRCRTADFVVSLPRHQSSESQCARLFVRRNFPENRGGTADPKPNSPQRRCLIGPGRHDAALIPAFKGGGHARSGQLLRAGPKQSILLNAAAPRAFARQNGVDRDPFATFAACGGCPHGCTPHHFARAAFCSGAAAARGGPSSPRPRKPLYPRS